VKALWVGHFTPYPPRGGAPQRSYNLIRQGAAHVELHYVGLAQHAHQPNIADIVEAETALGALCASATVIDARRSTTRAGKILALAKCLVARRSYNESVLAVPEWSKSIRAVIDRVGPDVIHVDSVMAVELLPSSTPVPAVLNHHNIESDMMARRAENDASPARYLWRREAKLLAQYEIDTASRFAEHLVVSALDGDRLRRLVPTARTTVIPNGVDTGYFAERTAEPDAMSLVFAGRMNWYPNENAMSRFIRELWPQIRERLKPVQLVIAGMNPPASLLRLAATDASIRVTGFVDDIRSVITGSLVYVCPILDGGGTRLKLLDAMSLGMPIVTTPMAVEGLEVQDGRHLLIREFGEEFVEGVVTCAHDAGLRQRVASEARSLVEQRYDWEIVGRALVGAWERAAESGSAPTVRRT
jgi:glycosyltransferase involved in cell wall biosynthesis